MVLKHTMHFRVEHIFLIHRKTGLLLAHSAAPEASAQDPQLVSSMLSAIQDFVRDSFSEEAVAAGRIDTACSADLLLWSEGQTIRIPCCHVIRGNP